MEEMQGIFRRKPRQMLPKKVMKSKRLYQSNKYTVQATLWVPDTPYDRRIPKIGLTISCAGEYLRIYFDRPGAIMDFANDFNRFLKENHDLLLSSWTEAVQEWISLHKDQKNYKKRVDKMVEVLYNRYNDITKDEKDLAKKKQGKSP